MVAGLTPGSPNNNDDSGRAINPQQTDGNCVNVNKINGFDDWPPYFSFIYCASGVLNRYRRADVRAPYFQVKLWEWAEERYPAPVVRVWKPFSGFMRWGHGVESVDDDEFDHHWSPTDFLITSKHLSMYLTP